ncbi:hypothetical protein GLOIN_2v1822442 [Rhizophagus irregularis DAOM 181602=DAOM 197198]|uniref:Uncharacterized protein n=1 Tax=Rhizophagus irregularis (strain DAOM 181602 / DAOM 197198 / MUCL 43194) TaxID=747089 RepID=A0A2P4NYA4_RHIID|nr:hypothetical protein GLOIN_2v1822442 [Rhizophagus irregularis DAOM 181602=DAOM 197198]POG58126.1 hypothetical protein GLOIN_2v1822442 [Rhizophagus irregularis DAOM 181602=DAOM 197198]|eukprot:XP_025164992.1 hypothetical protein GLOIN_2v1822442 [Rhizophagus irregularis DAOM 181602=DAOM 197198]
MDLWKVNSQKVDEEENNLQKFTESDIKDKLGGEEMNPRYLFSPSQQGISKVTTIFEEFLNSKHGEFLKKYIEKNDPLPSYESRIQLKSIVPASFTGGHPTLLKYNLPKSNENHEPITQVSNVQFAIAEAKNNLLIFLGTSGCGKMRTCYELLCENWGLYFVASRKENGDIFGKLYDYDDDMFVALMWELNTCTPESVITFIDKTYKKIPNNNKTFVIILDKTQVLETVFKGKFKSRTGEQKCSLLSLIIQALREPAVKIVNYCVILCGSGLGILSLEDVLITGVSKPDTEISKFTEFGGWQNIDHVKNYVNNLVSLTDNEYNCLYKHFRGRFCPIVTCVEEIIMGVPAQNVINVHWKQICKDVDEEMLQISSVNVDLLHPALEGKKSLVAYVDELFALTAGFNFFNDNDSLPKGILNTMSIANNDSSWGTLWQMYLPDEFERIFNGQSDIKNMPVFAEVTKKYNLPYFCKGSPKIVKSLSLIHI